MLRHTIFASLLSLGAVSMVAQQHPAVSAPTPNAIQLPAGTLPFDPAKLSAAIRDSYYHPDELSGLDCKVTFDWPAFFTALKVTMPADRLKTIQNLTTHVQTAPGKIPEFTFDWAGAVLDTKEQMESGLKEMIGGFYQMYWPMIASFPIQNSSEIKKIEPQPDGGATLYLPTTNASLILTVDKNHLPIHYSIDSPVMKGTIDPQYTASPNPVSGDLRRLTSMKVVEQIGNSTMNVDVDLDYQAVGGFYIPQHVTFDVGGAYSIKMEFSGCAVSKQISLIPKTK